ncbi:hypothetical protein PSTT_13155, partial [Puccinia striiformis]
LKTQFPEVNEKVDQKATIQVSEDDGQPIFILEAAIILSVLLALIEQIVKPLDQNSPTGTRDQLSIETPRLPRLEENLNQSHLELEMVMQLTTTPSARIMKPIEINYQTDEVTRTFAGLFCSMCIGAGFLAVYYTKLTDIYGNAEELWEGIFSLIASGMIFVMGITMMRIDRSKIKWRIKLSKAFEQENIIDGDGDGPQTFSKFRRVVSMLSVGGKRTDSGDSTSSRYILFFLPALTVLREGLEAVVFIGGVSLGQPAASIPIAAVTGIMLGLDWLCHLQLIRQAESEPFSDDLDYRVDVRLITKAAWYFKMYSYIRMVGGDAAEAGDGPGSFPVDGYIWHLDYGALINFVGCIQNQKKLIAPCFLTVRGLGNPENKLAAGGWMIFAGVFGWNNTGSILTVMIYISFWLIASATLIFMKWHEGRCTIFNVSSSARKQRLARLNGTGEGNQHDYDRD